MEDGLPDHPDDDPAVLKDDPGLAVHDPVAEGGVHQPDGPVAGLPEAELVLTGLVLGGQGPAAVGEALGVLRTVERKVLQVHETDDLPRLEKREKGN